MPCSKYLLLEQRYEEAIRSWGQIMASQLFGQSLHPSVQARQRALGARNAAKDRLKVHEQSCSICRREPRPGIPPTKAALV
jgi:hypothetical protein